MDTLHFLARKLIGKNEGPSMGIIDSRSVKTFLVFRRLLPVFPKRWIVERSFAWLANLKRLTIDYEFLPDTGEAMVQLAFTQIMLNEYFQ